MSGPISYPFGNKSEWMRLNETVCNIHHGRKPCLPAAPVGDEDTKHEWVSLRMYLIDRNRLQTGKTK